MCKLLQAQLGQGRCNNAKWGIKNMSRAAWHGQKRCLQMNRVNHRKWRDASRWRMDEPWMEAGGCNRDRLICVIPSWKLTFKCNIQFPQRDGETPAFWVNNNNKIMYLRHESSLEKNENGCALTAKTHFYGTQTMSSSLLDKRKRIISTLASQLSQWEREKLGGHQADDRSRCKYAE